MREKGISGSWLGFDLALGKRTGLDLVCFFREGEGIKEGGKGKRGEGEGRKEGEREGERVRQRGEREEVGCGRGKEGIREIRKERRGWKRKK